MSDASCDKELAALAALQQRLGEALCIGDPVQRCRDLLPELAIDGDGAKVAALLIAKLRFQRLIAASDDAMQWFERDPAAFAAAFRGYHQAVPVAALDPWAEAAAWAEWRG
ncbi:MAG: hypothetical protein H6835_17095 [Planctomycetes bacterium]|nr:hypothetical protein [Planctomycetota bacterium]